MSIFDPIAWDSKLKDVVRPHLARASLAGAVLQQEAVGVHPVRGIKRDTTDEDAAREAVEDILIDLPDDVREGIRSSLGDSLSQPYWSDINQTTLNRLDGALQVGLDQGMNLAETVKLVQKAIGASASIKRARAIARTEITGSLNAGNFEVTKGLERDGLVKGKEWLATLDSDTRNTHVAADGQQVAVTDMFLVGSSRGMYPGHYTLSAADRVNCRCTMISVTILDEFTEKPAIDPEPIAVPIAENPVIPEPAPVTIQPPDPKPKPVPARPPSPKPKPPIPRPAAPPKPAPVAETRPTAQHQIENAIKPPRFKDAKEAKKWLKENTYDSIRMPNATTEQLQGIADGSNAVLAGNGNRIKTLKWTSDRTATGVYTHKRTADGRVIDDSMAMQTKFTKQSASETKEVRRLLKERKKVEIKGIEDKLAGKTQLTLDSQVVSKLNDQLKNAKATKRWTVASDSSNPIKATSAHESGHTVYYQGKDIKTGENIDRKWQRELRAAKQSGLVKKIDEYKISEYAAYSPEELFSEVTSAIADGRSSLVPEGILNTYNKTLENYQINQ